MRAIVIGGTGHIGGFLIPLLVNAGYETIVAGTGRTAIPATKIWSKIRYIKGDMRNEEFLRSLADLHPQVVINIVHDVLPAYHIFKNTAKHIIACGSLWMYGCPHTVPTPEITQSQCVFDGYRIRYKNILELLKQSDADGVAFTAVMPPNICGPGKIPLECSGGRSLDVHKRHKQGHEVILPQGPDVLIGPCDAEDIAQCFFLVVEKPAQSAGRIFNVGSAYALTASKFVEAYADIYNVKIPVRTVEWDEYVKKYNTDIGGWWHFKAHMCPDISKAVQLLGYKPRYTPQQTLARAVDWMYAEKLLS